MIQFYFLSVLFNIITGLLLLSSNDGDEIFEGNILSAINNETFKFITGILAMAMGVLKLLSSTEGDMPVLGDLVPALAGLIGGFILCFEYYMSHTTLETSALNTIDSIFVKNKKLFGILALAAAVLHFLFPKVLFL
ncbi:MAG: hypothetical protein LBQ88_17230 [Treponema sp.]|jgi:hypothetical protein|nr:hypothetical protein [Treponema sp.]